MMNRRPYAMLLTLAPLLALAACDRGGEPQGKAAGGQILPGSASDAMLPYDTARSQPPLLSPAPRSAEGPVADASDTFVDEADAAADAAEEVRSAVDEPEGPAAAD